MKTIFQEIQNDMEDFFEEMDKIKKNSYDLKLKILKITNYFLYDS